MHRLLGEKYNALSRLSDDKGIIGALAIDQRGSLKKMISEGSGKEDDQGIIRFKELISEELAPYATSILLDPDYGIPASKLRNKDTGLLLAYEKTGYDVTQPGRLPDLLEEWSVKRIKDAGADAVKFLLYYDVDEDDAINELKHVYMERVGSECLAEAIPFFLEIVTYDANNQDTKGTEYAKVKPHKVNKAMEEFSKTQYHVDVLKVEVPVNINLVEGYTENETDVVYTREQAAQYFVEQSQATHLPFIFLSAGVSAEMFQKTLKFANKAGSTFNGVLCGRATWKNSVLPFATEGDETARNWLRGTGRKNIEKLNEVLNQTAKSWYKKVNKI